MSEPLESADDAIIIDEEIIVEVRPGDLRPGDPPGVNVRSPYASINCARFSYGYAAPNTSLALAGREAGK